MTKEKDFTQLNGLALAYVGDAVYEVYIRDYLVQKGQTKPNRLHHLATNFVSAKGQCLLMRALLEENVLTEKEEEMYRRGRNAKSFTSAKNTDITTYRVATGFESLIGYLHLTKQKKRVDEIVSWCIQKIEEKQNEKEDKK